MFLFHLVQDKPVNLSIIKIQHCDYNLNPMNIKNSHLTVILLLFNLPLLNPDETHVQS